MFAQKQKFCGPFAREQTQNSLKVPVNGNRFRGPGQVHTTSSLMEEEESLSVSSAVDSIGSILGSTGSGGSGGSGSNNGDTQSEGSDIFAESEYEIMEKIHQGTSMFNKTTNTHLHLT